jgi:GNAT superfamily N-acetyltransferase
LAIRVDIEFRSGGLTASEQSVVSAGFQTHTEEQAAPEYRKERVKWLAFDEQNDIRAILTADILWDWVYIDELWVCPELRGEGLGRKLMQLAEAFAKSQGLQGIWLWTQSWQAEGFYRQLGYHEFTRFDDFPKGHSRIGFRKRLSYSAPKRT